MDISNIVGMALSAVIAFFVSFGTISFKLGQLKEGLRSNNDRMNRLETRFDNFFLALSIPKESIESKVMPLIERLDRFINLFEKKKNPISTEQIDRLKTYRNKLVHGTPLEPKEYQDFQSLLKEISKELPRRQKGEFDWVVAALLGFIAGLIVGALIEK